MDEKSKMENLEQRVLQLENLLKNIIFKNGTDISVINCKLNNITFEQSCTVNISHSTSGSINMCDQNDLKLENVSCSSINNSNDDFLNRIEEFEEKIEEFEEKIEDFEERIEEFEEKIEEFDK